MSIWEPACGEYETDYEDRLSLVRWRLERIAVALALPIVLLVPFVVDSPTILLLSLIFITAIAIVGLNIIIGYTGEIVIAQGAFMAIGAYTTSQVLGYGTGLIPALLVAGTVSAIVALVFALPSFRVKGFYIAITTLALQFLAEWFFSNSQLDWIYGGELHRFPSDIGLVGESLVVTRGEPTFYYLGLGALLVFAWVSWNVSRTGIGRMMEAVRDNDLAAEVLGINVYRTKLVAFTTGGFIIGVSGGLYALYLRVINADFFGLQLTLDHFIMLIFGGLGSVWGAIVGTGAVQFLTEFIRTGTAELAAVLGVDPSVTAVRTVVFGLIIIAILAVEPGGLTAALGKVKRYIRNWPYAY